MNIQQAILAVIAIPGVLAIAAVAPNAFQILGLTGLGKRKFKSFQSHTTRARSRLIDKGFLEYKDGKNFLQLTEKGKKQLRLWGLGGYHIKKPKHWDKKFRILSFDIKEQRRNIRDKLRAVLSKMGFYRLQQSVWVYPYDCEDFIQLLKSDFRVGWDVLYIIADQVENEKVLMQHFGLKY